MRFLTKWQTLFCVFEVSVKMIYIKVVNDQLDYSLPNLCVIVDSGCVLVNYHVIEIVKSKHEC